ncbi:MAG: hypothetical protein L3J41_04340 [Melioribacteraceae bacterium]|nr:hypothetical protein [Melioribacteraceae bacterium]
MFEKEIEFIYNYNLNKIKHLGSFITYEQLISTNIHPALLQYVSAEIDFLIYEDRQKLLTDSLFDYSGEKIIEHFTNIGEEIKRSKKFSLEYLTKLLLHASSFNVNYIIRPKWSLLQFVFESENESSKQVVEVKQILNYLYYYPYLKRLLISFFNKKRIITITQKELEDLLIKIDKINYESNFDRVLDSALKNMVEFINMGESRNNKISKQSVELFLEDKGLLQYKMILIEKFGATGSDKYEINDYKNVILNYNIEYDTSTISEDENETINEKLEELKTEVNDYKEKLKEDDITDSENKYNDESEKDIENIEEDDLMDDKQNGKKSFLESHIDKLDEDILDRNDNPSKDENEILDEDIEEIEPPDFDEAPRVDDEIIDEAYEFITEEEELDAIVDEDSELERVEINEEDGDPFDDSNEDDIKKEKKDESAEITSEAENNEYIELGNSITFSSEQLTKGEDTAIEDNTSLEEEDEWHTESSNENSDDEVELDKPVEDTEVSDVVEEIGNGDSKVEEEMIKEVNGEDFEQEEAEAETPNNNELNSVDEELINDNDTNTQQVLFDDSDFDETAVESETENVSNEMSITDEETDVPDSPSIDISILLENKKITKIIEVVFDYDMEEFANAIDKISECKSEVEAITTIDEIAKNLFIDESTKEIKALKNIISDFFK